MSINAVNIRPVLEIAPSPQRRRVLFFIKAMVSLALLAYIVSSANLTETGYALIGQNFMLLLAAAALNPIGGVLMAWRWQGLLHSQGVDAPLYRLVQSCIAATFFRQFLPSTIGGDTIRAYDSWKLGATKGVAVATLAVDRVFGMIVLLLFALVALLLWPRLLPDLGVLPLVIKVGAGGLLIGVTLLFLPATGFFAPVSRLVEMLPGPLQKIINTFRASLAGFRERPGLMLRSLGISVLLQVNVVLFYYCIGMALGLPVPLLAYFVIVPIATIVMMLPIAINGIGLREGVFVLLLSVFDISASQAIAFAWLEYGLFLFYGMIGGVVYALRR